MVQYLELVLKRDLTSGLKHVAEKVGLSLGKTSDEDLRKKAEEPDWRDRSAKNWYY